jgi:predicted dehydrogenase
MTEPNTSRRDFLVGSTLAAAATTLSSGGVFAKGNDKLKIGLVGCGGRGTGAAINALQADNNVTLFALADAFKDRLDDSLAGLRKKPNLKDKISVTPETSFVGFDAYKKLIEVCDVVLLCTPPAFRPVHLKAAVDAGKHIFCEKPLAVDATGIRSVIATAQEAKKKGINLVSGFCYRYDYAKRETIKRIHDGAIGDINALQITYNTGKLWDRSIDAPISTMEFQMRNWYYFTWLSGDHIVEQHVHNYDKAAWVLKGELPTFATGTGGRQVRIEPKFGNIYDHFGIIFEFKDGKRMYSFCRQQPGCTSEVSDHILGSKGRAELMSHSIKGETNWTYQGEAKDMYQVEHDELFAAIRSGKTINDGVEAAYSTMMAIMGRMAAYSGKRISWDQAFNSKEDLVPANLVWGNLDVAPIATPGVTKLV